MKYEMHLNDGPFNQIKNGTKTIELRLNDEKRRLLKAHDLIEFINLTTSETILTEIINLYQYANFLELYKYCDKTKMGYKIDEDASYKDMEKYYNEEDETKYGVLGIELKLVKKEEK